MTKAQSLEPIPLRPDPGALRERNVKALVRACIATARARHHRGIEPGDIVEHSWPTDETARLVLRAASEPPDTISGTSALARTVIPDFVAAMAPFSAAASLINAGLSFAFDGAAYISVPSFTAIPTGVAYVGEAQPVPVVQFTATAPPPLTAKKLATIAVLTEEMISSSNAEALVKNVLLRSVGLAIDKYLFDAIAADTNRPAGLLHGVSGLTPSGAGTGGYDTMISDLTKLASAVAPVGGRIAFIVSPARAVNINMRSGYPLNDYSQVDVLPSAAVPDTEVVAIAVDGFVSAMDVLPEIRASNNATIHMDNAPQPIASAGTMASPARSLWQTGSVGLILRLPLDWALRSPAAVAWMTGVVW
jgi:Phage capsid family